MPYLKFEWRGIVNFTDYVWFALILQDDSDIKKPYFLHDCIAREINKLLFVASWRNIGELELETWICVPFEFPSCLLHCKSLRVVKWSLNYGPLEMPNFTGISKLKSFHVKNIKFDGNLCEKPSNTINMVALYLW